MTKQLLITAILDLDPNATPEYLAKLTKAELASWLEALEDDEITGEYSDDLDENGNPIPLDEV